MVEPERPVRTTDLGPELSPDREPVTTRFRPFKFHDGGPSVSGLIRLIRLMDSAGFIAKRVLELTTAAPFWFGAFFDHVERRPHFRIVAKAVVADFIVRHRRPFAFYS